MIVRKQERRSFLFGLAGLGIGHAMLQSAREVQAAPSQGYVLGPNGGEHLVHFRNPGNIFINVSPAKGSDNLAFGTQQVPVGAGIPIHRHFQMDEAFSILEGSGTFILNDARHPIEKGGTIDPKKPEWRPYIFARDQWHCRICGDRFLYSEMVRKHIADAHDETIPPSMYEYFHGAVWQRKKMP